MIDWLVTAFDNARPHLGVEFEKNRPREYVDVVAATLKACAAHQEIKYPFKHAFILDEIFELDGDSCQTYIIPYVLDYGARKSGRSHIHCTISYGLLVRIFGGLEDFGRSHIHCTISYGSCSECDTMCAINDEQGEQALTSLMQLALHVVQQCKHFVVYE